MSRQDRLPKLRYRAIRYPNGRYLPPVYDPPRIRVRGDHGHDSWISIEEGDIVARFKTFAEAHIAAEQMTAEVRGHGPASGRNDRWGNSHMVLMMHCFSRAASCRVVTLCGVGDGNGM
jgi:hypothetical protein